jgi:hypothetical protein
MKIKITVHEASGPKDLIVESEGAIYIDLAPNQREGRITPGEGNGFFGPECLVQMEMNATRSHFMGINIVPELGRDDSQYMESLDIKEIPKV